MFILAEPEKDDGKIKIRKEQHTNENSVVK